MMYSNNKMELSGELVAEFEFDHESHGEKFYKSVVKTYRHSGVADFVPIVASEKLFDMSYSWSGEFVELRGQYRSWNRRLDNGRTKLELYMFVDYAKLLEYSYDVNHLELEGFIVKKPTYRKTPNGRYVTDTMLAVNRSYGKTYYIPLILWGRDAALSARYEVGTHIGIVGRVQSREYFKRLEDGTEETRIAYEVSVRDVWEV